MQNCLQNEWTLIGSQCSHKTAVVRTTLNARKVCNTKGQLILKGLVAWYPELRLTCFCSFFGGIEDSFRTAKNEVLNIQAASYNGAHMIIALRLVGFRELDHLSLQ